MSRASSAVRSSWLVPLAGSLLAALAGCGGGASTGTGAAGTGGDTSTSGATGSTTGSGGGSPDGFLDKYPLTSKFPEGGTYDPVSHAFYVGSLDDGSVRRVDAATGAETVIFTETAPGVWWTLGMDVDVVRRRLWVCAMDDRSPDPRAGSVWVFDLETGARIANHALADAAMDATCTDVAVTKDGVGYVCDREAGNVYQVTDATGATLFTSSPHLEASVVGQNALVVLPDHSALLSLLYLPSGLARIDLADGSVVPVEINGTFSDSSLLHGADGMTYANGSVYVAFTQKLIRLTPSLESWASADSKEADIADGMTDVIATPNGLYLLNGQSLTFAVGSPPKPFSLVKFAGAL